MIAEFEELDPCARLPPIPAKPTKRPSALGRHAALNRDNVPKAVRVCLAAVPTQQRLQEGLQIIKEVLERGPTTHFTTT